MSPLKISIITVCFNAAQTIERAMRSVDAQTYPHIEHIIVDGASTDNTLEIVNKYVAKVNKLVSEKDNGIYDAMNKGIALSTGDVLYFLNADDYFCDDNVVKDVAQAFADDSSRTLVYGQIKPVNAPNHVETLPRKYPIKSADDFLYHTICHQAIFAKRSLFSSVGVFNCQYKYAADYEWQIKAYQYNPSGFFYLNREIANFYYLGRNYLNNVITRQEKRKIRLRFRHLFSSAFIWYFFRCVLLRGLKKRIFNEPW